MSCLESLKRLFLLEFQRSCSHPAQAWGNNIYQVVLLILGILWSTRSALPVISVAVPEQRRVLAVYPVLLLYFMLGWIALVSL